MITINEDKNKKFNASFEYLEKQYKIYFDTDDEFFSIISANDIDYDEDYIFGSRFILNEKFIDVSSSYNLEQLVNAFNDYGEDLAFVAHNLLKNSNDIHDYDDALDFCNNYYIQTLPNYYTFNKEDHAFFYNNKKYYNKFVVGKDLFHKPFDLTEGSENGVVGSTREVESDQFFTDFSLSKMEDGIEVINETIGKFHNVQFNYLDKKLKIFFDEIAEYHLILAEIGIDEEKIYGHGFVLDDRFIDVSSHKECEQMLDAISDYGESLAYAAYKLFIKKKEELNLKEYVDALEIIIV